MFNAAKLKFAAQFQLMYKNMQISTMLQVITSFYTTISHLALDWAC